MTAPARRVIFITDFSVDTDQALDTIKAF